MNHYSIEEFYRTPGLLESLHAEARRERSRSLHAGLEWAAARVKALFSWCIGPLHWTERLG